MKMEQIDKDRYAVDLTAFFTTSTPFISFGKQNVSVCLGPVGFVLCPKTARGFFELVADSVKTIDLLIEDRKAGLLKTHKYVVREYALGPLQEDVFNVNYSVSREFESSDFLDIRGGPLSIAMFESKQRHEFADALGFAVEYMEGLQDGTDKD